MDLKDKMKIESEFLAKYPSDILESWDSSHHDIPRVINERGYRIGVEVGVAYGGHSECILRETQVEKLYGVDPYTNYTEYEGDAMNHAQRKLDDIHEMVSSRLSYYGDRFSLIRDYSASASHGFEDGSLDFVYIDGNHFERFVLEDLDAWYPKVRQGGTICGHDYNHPVFPGLTTIVNKFFADRGLQVHYLGNHNWCVYK
jgi:hypothetical protein